MSSPTAKNPGVVFIARFFAGLVAFYLLAATEAVNEFVVVPFTGLVVRASALLLRGIHEPIQVAGTVIRTSSFALDVHVGCNGVEAMMLLAAALLAFPATFRSRLTGLLVGCSAIQLLNLVRVSSLVWLGEHHRALFDIVHVGVWQTVVILAAVSMFVAWSVRYAEKPLPARR